MCFNLLFFEDKSKTSSHASLHIKLAMVQVAQARVHLILEAKRRPCALVLECHGKPLVLTVRVPVDIQGYTFIVLAVADAGLEELVLKHLLLRQKNHESACRVQFALQRELNLELELLVPNMRIKEVRTASICHSWVDLDFIHELQRVANRRISYRPLVSREVK